MMPAATAVASGGGAGARRREAVVIGAGVSGLCSAVRLAEDGWEVLVVAAEARGATTSDGCGGYWYPYKSFPAERTGAWARETLAAFEGLVKGRDGVGAFVRTRRSRHYVCGGGPEAEEGEGEGPPAWAPEDWRAMGAEDWYDVPEAYPRMTGGIEFSGPVVEMPRFLGWLHAEVARLGGTVVTGRRLARVEDALEYFPCRRCRTDPGATRVVVNCAGLGNRMSLARDGNLVGARGQVLYVDAPGLTDVLNVTARHADGSESFCYAIPRGDFTVLGGTYEVREEHARTSPEVERRIWATCVDLLPPGSLDGAKIKGTWAGLRPVREAGVRLQLEPLGSDAMVAAAARGVEAVISNYGHGGSGVTLCWGCADDVVRLANDLAAHRS